MCFVEEEKEENVSKYIIEYRSSHYEGAPGEQYVVQSLGGSFHEFEAVDDGAAQKRAPDEWKLLIENARKAGLRSVGFISLVRAPDPSPVPIAWAPQ